MSSWSELRLEDVCETITDGAHFSPKEDSKGLPMASVKDLTRFGINIESCKRISQNDFDKLVAQGCAPRWGDVLIAKDGNSALDTVCVYRQENEVVLLSSVAILRPNNRVTSDFLNYYLDSSETRSYLKDNFRSGSAIPRVVLRDFRRAPIRVPPLPIQEAIGWMLRALDDKIELNRRMNETLEAIARAMFKSWFVDFDPVRAKASSEPPESICRRLRLTPDLLAPFPDRLVNSELGEIPEGWEVGTIGHHCYLNAESWTTKTMPKEVHYVDLANAKGGIISEIQVFSSSTAPSRARRVLRAGDTIVGTVRPGNRSFALIGQETPQLTGSTGFAVLSPRRNELREFVYYLATNDDNISRLSRLADGAAYPAVRPEVVTSGVCVLPPSDVIDAFHAATAEMVDYQIANRVNNHTLATIRDTLLPKLLSGELRMLSHDQAVEVVA